MISVSDDESLPGTSTPSKVNIKWMYTLHSLEWKLYQYSSHNLTEGSGKGFLPAVLAAYALPEEAVAVQ